MTDSIIGSGAQSGAASDAVTQLHSDPHVPVTPAENEPSASASDSSTVVPDALSAGKTGFNPTANDIAVVTVDKMLSYMDMSSMPFEVNTGADVAKAIMQRILDAESVDEIFAAAEAGTISAVDLVNKPLTITEIKFNRSTFSGDNSLGFFAVCDYALKETPGIKSVFTVGATAILAQLFKFNYSDLCPIDVIIRRKDTPTAAGYYPMWLAPAR